MATEQPNNPEESQPNKPGGWRGKISSAVDSARSVAEKAAESARDAAANAPEPVKSAAESAKAAAGSAGERVKRPIDIISLAEFRTEFEQFTQAVSTAVIGVHQDQATLGERLDRLEERLTRLEQATFGNES